MLKANLNTTIKPIHILIPKLLPCNTVVRCINYLPHRRHNIFFSYFAIAFNRRYVCHHQGQWCDSNRRSAWNLLMQLSPSHMLLSIRNKKFRNGKWKNEGRRKRHVLRKPFYDQVKINKGATETDCNLTTWWCVTKMLNIIIKEL